MVALHSVRYCNEPHLKVIQMNKKKLIENIHTKVKFLEKDLKKLKTLEEEEENGKNKRKEN